MPVDHKHDKHRIHIKTFNWISPNNSWDILKYIVNQCNVIGAHLATPWERVQEQGR